MVIVRLDGNVVCLEDRCPHRNVPLSDGFVEKEHIRCGYHGWTFDAQGVVTKIPGCTCKEEKIAIKMHRIRVEEGIIWVCLEGERAFYNPFQSADFDRSVHFKSVKADFLHTIENFLDPTHTPFIHKGLLRHESKQRMNVSQELKEEGFVTHYTLLDKQNGLINKLFDNGVDTNSASFSMPGFAQIDYLKKSTLLLRVAIFFVPHSEGEVGMVVCVSLPKSSFSKLKFWMVRPFMELAFHQDKVILEKQFMLQKVYNKPYCSTEVDFVVDHLIHFLASGTRGICKIAVIEL